MALSNPHPFSDGGTPSLVLDADGGRLQAGVNYLVLPVIPGRGGGLSPANINEKSSCPHDIIQEASEAQTGFPVRFSPVDTATGSVPLSTDINVKFFTPTVCSNETVWRVGKYDEVLKRYFIVTGGVEGNPGPETIANWFKIEKLESDYKIVFCPSVCSFCQVVCDDVGIYVGTGEPHGPPPPVPEPHRPPPPPIPVPAGSPPPDTSLAVATLESPAYARPFVIFVSVLLFLELGFNSCPLQWLGSLV
nr:miraculin-like [Ipomoea batatas]